MSNTDGTAAPKGTFHGTMRWFVHRGYARDTRFGERRGPLVWQVSTIIHRTGSKGLRLGAPTTFGPTTSPGSHKRALAYAHKQAQRTYGPRKDRS